MTYEGLYGGTAAGPFVGAWVIDAGTGKRAQVEEVLGERWFLVRFEDGTVDRVQIRPPTPDELDDLRQREQ